MADMAVDLPREARTLHPILLAFLRDRRAAPPSPPTPLPRLRLSADSTEPCSSEPSSAKEAQVQYPCPDCEADGESGDVMVVEGSSGVGLGLCKEAQADLVALFVLLVMAMRRPKAYLGGLIRLASATSSDGSLVDKDGDFSGATSPPISSSILLSQVSKDALDLLDVPYLMRKFNFEGAKDAKKWSPDPACVARFLSSSRLMDIVKTFQFVGIKRNNDNYVNTSLVQWSLGLRPFVLLFYVPTPMEVLRMQSVGERVVTMFVTVEALSKKHSAKLYYMDGAMDHEKDPLEFTIHDMKHMENFTDPAIFAEQVGFFRCMLHLGSPLYRERVAGVMAKRDEQFRILTGSLFQLKSTGTTAYDSKNLLVDCYPDDLSHSISPSLAPDVEKDRLVAPAVSTSTSDVAPLLREISSPVFEEGLCPARNWAVARWSTEAGLSRPKHVFTDAACFGLDAALWHELEYVISDMNCFSTHLLQYLLAKMMLAVERRYPMPTVPDSFSTINLETKLASTSTELVSSSSCSSKTSVQYKRRDIVTLYWILILRGFGMMPKLEPSDDKAEGIDLGGGGGEAVDRDERMARLQKLRSAAFSACLNMLSTSYRERGPMTAQEGQDIRDYFGLIVGWVKG